MKKILILILAITQNLGVAIASDASAGKVYNLHFMNNGSVIFYHTGNRNGSVPACGNNFLTRWEIDATAPGGQSQAAALLTVFSQDKRISVKGKNSCDIWGDTETVLWFTIVD